MKVREVINFELLNPVSFLGLALTWAIASTTNPLHPFQTIPPVPFVEPEPLFQDDTKQKLPRRQLNKQTSLEGRHFHRGGCKTPQDMLILSVFSHLDV